MSDMIPSTALDAIAIVGMSGRFPGADDIDEFWANLRDGVESITFFSKDDLINAGVDASLLENPAYVTAKAIIDDADKFDATFFGYTPREAEMMDPQHRIFLECSWHALEHAGYNPKTCDTSIGVFAGTNLDTYLLDNLDSNDITSASPLELRLGSDNGFLATRVSYKLGLKGPGITIQTACSTSLVAICQACQSLMTYQCDMALAGAATVKVPRVEGYLFQENGITSPDGHCRTFDACAHGTVPGEGVAVIVLKRLEDALSDNDSIYAVIKGWAVNNDGDEKVGYTAPSVNGQAEVISLAQSLAGIDADSITYIEAHGTGTELGDPIEVAALNQAFSETTDKNGFCTIGSVKTNIGHLDATAGIAGLIKTVLAMQHRQIPPHLHFESPNPKINFDGSPFRVNTELSDWNSGSAPMRAGVSSFGMGGTNSHVVLEQAPLLTPGSNSASEQLLLFSARTAGQLNRVLRNFNTWLQNHPAEEFANAAYTLKVGRKRFDHAAMLVCKDSHSAIEALENRDSGGVATSKIESTEPPVVFMFPGQGNQYLNMGRELYLEEPAYKEIVDLCCEFLNAEIGIDLRTLMYTDVSIATSDNGLLNETRYAQPALFVAEYALANVLMKWGVRAQALIGHSIGEYVAACISGVLSLQDALLLVANRAALMQSVEPGCMTAVPLSAEQLKPHLSDQLSLAVVNDPGLCVASGPAGHIDRLESKLGEKGIPCTRLHTSHAFHSGMMDPILKNYRNIIQQIRLSPPQIPYISNLTGSWITAEQATDPDYWVSHLRNTVQFSAGIQQLLSEPDRILVEVGPGTSLTAIAGRHQQGNTGHIVISTMHHAREDKSDMACLLESLGRLWLSGTQIDWDSFYANERRRRIALPGYPFERKHYWIRSKKTGHTSEGFGAATGSEKRPDMSTWFYVPTWTRHPVTTANKPVAAHQSKVHWLLFINDTVLERQFTADLQSRGDTFDIVRTGSEFCRNADNSFTIRVDRPDDYRSLFNILNDERRMPANILYSYSLGSITVSNNMAAIDADIDACFFGPLYIAQAIGDAAFGDEIKLVIATNRMQTITGTEQINPYKAVAIGPVLVIPKEYPRINCHAVDFDVAALDKSASRDLSSRTITEFDLRRECMQVAYRGNFRWMRHAVQFPIQPSSQPMKRLRTKGTYLISGGLGGIGLTLAGYLGQAVSARLILVSRSVLPDAAEWDDWLSTHPQADPVSHRIRQIRKIESYGADVVIESADVANIEQMRAVVERATGQFGEIRGVIHAAGVPTGGMIQLKTSKDVSTVTAPKVQGTYVLDTLFEDHDLDFMVLCSSLVTEEGAVGQVDYTAANAFLDAFAQYRMSLGKFTVAIGWDAWSDVGMAVDMDVPDEMKAQKRWNLSNGISCEEGAEIFSRILDNDVPQVIISTRSTFGRSELIDIDSASVTDNQPDETPAGNYTPGHDRPATMTHEYAPPETDLQATIAGIWQELFGIYSIGIHDSFYELGGHSLLGVQIISRINSDLNVRLTMNEFFDAPSIAALSGLVEKHLSSVDIDSMIDQLSDEEVSKLLADKGIGL